MQVFSCKFSLLRSPYRYSYSRTFHLSKIKSLFSILNTSLGCQTADFDSAEIWQGGAAHLQKPPQNPWDVSGLQLFAKTTSFTSVIWWLLGSPHGFKHTWWSVMICYFPLKCGCSCLRRQSQTECFARGMERGRFCNVPYFLGKSVLQSHAGSQ